MEIEQRLGLYRVFLKLYEYHRSLLDEILQLENADQQTLSRLATRYVTGVIQCEQSYLITNLVESKTQTLLQPQGIWTIGRARQLAMSIPERHLSRYHAVIQYIQDHGFYLIDLNSTNGSFVNGEPIHEPMLLKDGDRLRLSNLTFSFFLCNNTQTVGTPPRELLTRLQTSRLNPQSSKLPSSDSDLELLPTSQQPHQKEETSRFLEELSELDEFSADYSTPQVSSRQQSDILDRFFIHQQSQKSGKK
ncbi:MULTISPECIES: FHA domain-containing protein [unclassified Coleofasciculus]|uniref:FHA domain-containing protein n=1 Tax=unclassified Coleofasciculus TaxID=2692782 RepID=UPI0018824440|nr:MULTISPECIES: FHA domain-containing protein [unclassified Coleofasciculus]MBE9129940.1 FHA domain-containing protein [Coleofasciculus sp. LEGE 07081]MBE9151393.1 FHA domain-containing protein [Coleofasciculus sp. LEGE 07092]